MIRDWGIGGFWQKIWFLTPKCAIFNGPDCRSHVILSVFKGTLFWADPLVISRPLNTVGRVNCTVAVQSIVQNTTNAKLGAGCDHDGIEAIDQWRELKPNWTRSKRIRVVYICLETPLPTQRNRTRQPTNRSNVRCAEQTQKWKCVRDALRGRVLPNSLNIRFKNLN